ncbi:family 78 glycoside hydrolase catalytic domain [Spirosoma aureum]|uniref:alpha-L-rhamnosidase n=1 Tax=Spirosoma aureum TaxID=2692134 RepID=A0A6G9AXW4_9BACT|nr:alpha-L-rhamnosidase [Spirosoma aureum]QIP17321.1 family 78 glycoside hydrolase catalytic domain [Spirosoma aureum]
MKFVQSSIRSVALILSAMILSSNQSAANKSDLKPVNLRTEYKINPVVDAAKPRLSWELTSAIRGQVQTAYQIMVASSPNLLATDTPDLWNSTKLASNATNQIEYAGKLLPSRTVCYWKVRSWDKYDQAGPWSAIAGWEMGLLNKSDWKAEWIGNDLRALGKGKIYHLPPAPFFRREAQFKATVKRARLYVTSLGLYEFQINGKRVGTDYFTPGWTDYNKRVYYQTYDVTADVKIGKNALGAIVAEGWYAGYLGYALLVGNPVVKNFYGDVPLLKAQLEVEYTNGEKETIATDQTWKTNHGPVLEADLLNGETYNANLEFANWSKVGYADSNWKNSTIYPDKSGRKIEAYPGYPIQVFQELKSKTVTPKSGGKYLFDLGQNFAGNVRLKVKGNKGDTITLKYGEVLFPNGEIMTENLRKARATDTYILKGDKQGETWTPKFTYHGFQYVEVAGFRTVPGLDAITGIVLTSATPETGSFETDNKLINKLYQNIVWTQRSNYVDVPTDCPQRDERLGWTGDAQAYIQSATFNTDISAFFTKWLVDLNDAQRADKSYPIYAPAPNVRKTDTYSPGWSEAGIICPYTIYKTYGDTRVIREFWPNMVAYLRFMEAKSKGEYVYKEASFEDISPKGGFGDWLSVGKKTPPDMLATMYYAYVASMMAEMANAIDKQEESTYYHGIFNKIKQAFLAHYTEETGKFKTNSAAYGDGGGYVDGQMGFDGHTQTAYANAIYMHMLKPDQNQKAGDWLVELIKANNNKLSTGFLGVKPLLPSLSSTGHSDEAYKLLLSTEYPSWGFEVVNGANTIWERWNSYIKGKGFENNAGMNSFNHYAFGAVNEWLFGNAAGLKVGEAGYRTFTIKPEIANEGLNYVNATYRSINGKIESSWKKAGKTVTLKITVPVNTVATVFIPTTNPASVVESAKEVKSNPAIKVKEFKDGYLYVEIGSGTYQFMSQN